MPRKSLASSCRRVACGVCAVLSWSLAALAAQPGLVYSRAADAVVVEFSERPGELAASEAGLSLQIHGDGRFVVRRPPGMRRAGEHTGRLTPAELDALLARLAARGVLEYDAAPLARAARAPGEGLARETSDPAWVTLVIRAQRTAPRQQETPSAARAPEQRIRVRGLRGAARAHPDDAALAGLAESCAELRALIDAAADGDPS